MKNKTALTFLVFALVTLALGILFGLLASLQYIFPTFIKSVIPFSKMRPFHVTTVISWIILAATGSIYFYMVKEEKLSLFSFKLPKAHLLLFLATGVTIYFSFMLGYTEGREYLSFSPILTIPVLLGWILFGLNYFKTLRKSVKNWPVYYWMWGTGIVFMVYHLCEAHFWLIPSFKEHFVKDIAVQWKSYGSFVGSWNMLVYGISIYIMCKIKGDEKLARGKKAFFFYFLGLTNLMFGWAHHTYIIPMQPWIRYVAYGISMTEWIILAHIIYSWKQSLSIQKQEEYPIAYKFLVVADLWVFLNLILALVFSIPAINFFTHGTHITVAHSMGTTIGINTSILFASLFFIASKLKPDFTFKKIKQYVTLYNVSLLLFWVVLLMAGIKKSHWMYFTKNVLFSEMQESLFYVYIAFFSFGLLLVISILRIITPLFFVFIKNIYQNRVMIKDEEKQAVL
ncbi:cbb3-type cytochrome c oxidase subunit I [Tenacibaculum caenipelagi]|uniref:Nitric oxide reductase subunit B n=1 Tax=Tenacibaculum caenipelagi TaxID=1325435 RepID=A0A4R6TB43_9FLAO|nr:cbb3-type cytochrome c oxidase subunit I [Tenacibaculum caenipelagi]TDQ25401.1 nitric oxide reductase subunit B [Tenacibaculum caenipelagi]